jgi:hypothetical protein
LDSIKLTLKEGLQQPVNKEKVCNSQYTKRRSATASTQVEGLQQPVHKEKVCSSQYTSGGLEVVTWIGNHAHQRHFSPENVVA